MDNPIEEVKKKIDIVEFIGGFATLKKAGRNYKGLCPFHQEKTPSFVVSPDRQIWHCFGSCGDGGDAIKFLMKWENITFYEALKELAEKVGVKLKTVDFEDQAWKTKEKFFSLNNLAQEFYHFVLTKHPAGEAARAYLKSRGINDKIIETFKLGFSPPSWDSLLKYLKKKGESPVDAANAGLTIKSDRGDFYDRFRKRLIFPLRDPRGNTLGFSGRTLDDTEKEAKYVNTPETLIYHKRETLFGIDLVKKNIQREDSVIIVEGEFDMISLYQEGVDNVVAVKGSAVTREQMMLLKRFSNKMTLALDSDLSGEETTKRTIKEAENLDFEIRIATFDFGKDPDEAIKADAALFKKIIKKPTPVYDYIIDLAVKKYPGRDAFSKKNIGDLTIPYLTNIQNPIVKSHYVKSVAEILDVEANSVESLLMRESNRLTKKSRTASAVQKNSELSRFELLQKYILSILFQSLKPIELTDRIFSILSADDFSTESYKKLINIFTDFKKNNATALESDTWIRQFIGLLPKELSYIFDEIFLFDATLFDETVTTTEENRSFYELKKLSLKKKIKDTISDVENLDKRDTVKHLTEELQGIENKLEIL